MHIIRNVHIHHICIFTISPSPSRHGSAVWGREINANTREHINFISFQFSLVIYIHFCLSRTRSRCAFVFKFLARPVFALFLQSKKNVCGDDDYMWHKTQNNYTTQNYIKFSFSRFLSPDCVTYLTF